jgi:putative transposase
MIGHSPCARCCFQGSNWEALEPIRQGLAKHFGAMTENVAAGLILRHDNGPDYRADDFQDEIKFLGSESSPAFVRQPEGNSLAERVIRTLKQQLLWVRYFPTAEALRKGLAEFADLYNTSWLRERHGHKTPNQIRAEQKALASEAATEFKLAA